MTVNVDTTTEPVNLTAYGGDTWQQSFRFMQSESEPWDLTIVYIDAQARSTLGESFALVVSVPNPSDGVVQIGMPAGGLEPDLYDYDIQFNDGQRVATYVHGKLRVRRDVTA